jgi:two-component system response regulator DegU
MVNASGEFTMVGEAENGELACVLAQQLQPDVILMDVSMPRMNGIEATRWIKTTLPQVVIIGLSVYLSADVAQDMRAAGTSAYLTKDTSPEDLYQAIHSALLKLN